MSATIAAYHGLSRLQRMPTAAEAQMEAAVFTPLIFVPSLMITPAPRKPMPETICAATRVTSAFICLVEARNENDVNANAPTQTITFVKIPVLCFVSCLSEPITIPKATAMASLIPNPKGVVIAGI